MTARSLGSAIALGCVLSACSFFRSPSDNASPRAITEVHTLLSCTFDDATASETPSTLERQFRMQIRGDRMRFAVRAGNCLSHVDQSVRASNPALMGLTDAFSVLLPIIQSANPDEIAMEREIRHISQQYRRATGTR